MRLERSNVAQWERIGLIIQRSWVRTLPLLLLFAVLAVPVVEVVSELLLVDAEKSS